MAKELKQNQTSSIMPDRDWETGEFEPDLEGEPQPIMEMELFQYANMHYLKQELTPQVYDQVRVCLGLEPLATATAKGKEQSKKILNTSE